MNENQPPQTYQVPTLSGIWKSMDTAPKDRPIVVWCVHEANTYVDLDSTNYSLTIYGAFCEQLNHCEDGLQVMEWGGGYDDVDRENGVYASLPDWWFVRDTNFELVANPILWADIPTKCVEFTPVIHYEFICTKGHHWHNPTGYIKDSEACPVCSSKPTFKAIIEDGCCAPKDLIGTETYIDPEFEKIGVVLDCYGKLYAPDLKCDKWTVVE